MRKRLLNPNEQYAIRRYNREKQITAENESGGSDSSASYTPRSSVVCEQWKQVAQLEIMSR